MQKMENLKQSFWSMSVEDILNALESSKDGLTSGEAGKRLSVYGLNSIKPPKRRSNFTLLISQFKSPIIIILFFATGLSFFLRDTLDEYGGLELTAEAARFYTSGRARFTPPGGHILQ